MTQTLASLAADLTSGRTTSESIMEGSLAAIANPAGQGAKTFLSIEPAEVRAAARASDRRRTEGRAFSRFDGIPFSVKDLFDIEGQVTKSGSRVLADAPPARSDAVAIARLKAQGFIVLGRTNMTEFAYSGVGLNPHYGTPLCAFDRATGRIPGGSSSGAAISVADGFCALGIGTDTGGSCRIPAAYNGIVGFKPTASRVPREGCYPLSESFDSIGPLANSVECCAVADAIMSGEWDGVLPERPLAGVRALVLTNFVQDGLATDVATDFSRALRTLSGKDVMLREVRLEGLEELPAINSKGGIVAAEAYAHHAPLIAKAGERYDQRVRGRIEAAAAITPEELARAKAFRKEHQERFHELMAEADVILAPTAMNIAPPIAALAEDRDYFRLNAMSLRNTYVFNFLDGCAISLPMQQPGTAPTGLMLAAPGGKDRELLTIAAAVAAILR